MWKILILGIFFGNLVKIKISGGFFMEIPKPAVSQLQACRWRSNMQCWWDGLVSYYSTLSITARAIAFFIKTHLSLKLNLGIWRNVFVLSFFTKFRLFRFTVYIFLQTGVLALCYLWFWGKSGIMKVNNGNFS